MDLRLWALAFTVADWPERQKAEIWAALQAGEEPRLTPPQAAALAHLEADLPRRREEAQVRGARLLLPGDPGVDELLAPLPYPVALWVRGTLPPPRPRIALVGSRQASRRGVERARAWAKDLTQAGVAVLSGLARGIDGAAHRGALEAGATWGVMGSGLDHPYPPEHRDLMDRMAASGGGVITPFPPEAPPRAWHFPRRNWLLAAWTEGVLVVEARRKSGSLVTARLALDLGKELWVCPGSPEDPSAEGPNFLLREGAAHICLSPADLLEDLAAGRVP
ncbi:DNA-processing protein DprA [Geothrix sp. 21YS21S-4]|uniref:DNA-processing protein DprA n=1 Tax=Geothrix sp. 21YS21S-4 TaxID=3068889 RepID=UPI0027B9BE8A|nr:DNA-processing protein DprA [Geothrix sp. 21YS21S-4]